MSMNNNNPTRNVGAPSQFTNLGSLPVNHQTPHLLSQAQSQTQGVSHFPGHFQVPEPRAQALAYTQGHVQGQAQAQAQAVHSQYQAQFQTQSQSLSQLQNPSISNVGAPSPSSSLIGTGSAKKSSQRPPSRPAGGSSNPNTASPFKTMELAPAALRKKRKFSKKQLPDKVSAILPESVLYNQLLELEARMDSAMTRKKMDIQESLKNPSRFRKTLRIYVFNTFENQRQESLEKKSEEPPSWSLKIVGRILEDEKDPVVSGMVQKQYPRFSSFFKKITVYLDQSLYPDNHVILWESSRSSAVHEGFEVKRKGDKEFTAMVRLEMNYKPEKFKLSPALTEALGIEVETRPRIIATIWHYVKSRRLQNPNDPATFMCDPPLQKVFGEDKMKFSMVSEKISQHLIPPQPIHLEHKIRLSGNCPSGTTCYDVPVDVAFPSQKELSAFLSNMESQKEINDYDELISQSIKKLHEHYRRRAFFLGFSHSPGDFVNALIASQSKDLKLAAGEASHNAEKEGCSEFYGKPWVEDAVLKYLNRKSAATDAPGST